MRRILHGDVSSAARALLVVSAVHRTELCKRMIHQAEDADVFARHTGYAHPVWGNGSLMSAARKHVLATEPGFDDVEYCQCFEIVLHLLVEWHTDLMQTRCI